MYNHMASHPNSLYYPSATKVFIFFEDCGLFSSSFPHLLFLYFQSSVMDRSCIVSPHIDISLLTEFKHIELRSRSVCVV